MNKYIDNAGLGPLGFAGSPEVVLAPAPSAKRLAVQAARRALRRTDATDEEVDDALEALVEAARLED